MCKPGSPHYEAALKDQLAKKTAGDKTNETGGKGEKNAGGGKGDKEKETVGGKARAKNKDSDKHKRQEGNWQQD